MADLNGRAGGGGESVQPRFNPFILLRRLYDWVLSWAETPYGVPALFFIAFAESSFFPVPPDILIIALALSIPARAFRYAAVASLGSVLGGMLGYYIGMELMDLVGWPLLRAYGVEDRFVYVQEIYRRYDAWAVGISAFTPIPFKVFTIAGGACRIDFGVFVLVSFIGRSLRFFLVGGLIYLFGAKVKDLVDRYFNLLTVIFTILFVLGFAAIKWIW